MARPDFFPDLVFGWTFFCVLVLYLIVAAIVDFRSLRVPKVLTLSCLAVGLIFNLSRGMWLGTQDKVVWMLPVGPLWGFLDGFLFSVAGFATAFAIFFLLWFVRAAGGGDVKLFAAVGTWLGPTWAIWVMIGSVVMVILITAAMMAWSFVTRGAPQTKAAFSHEKNQKAVQKGKRGGQRGPSFSFPLLTATTLVMLIVLRYDLRIAPKLSDAAAVDNKAAGPDSEQATK
jgi:Flp pilus assembly protein protease CpaA